jgi:hypothetical protein
VGRLRETHRVRYPPFEAARWVPASLPIAEQHHDRGEFQSESEAILHAAELGPEFQLGSEDGWLLQRTYQFDGQPLKFKREATHLEEAPFVDLINLQRRGWYLVPNPIHNILRRFINGVVIVLLLSLFYLFVSPLLILLGLPVYGLETVRWGLLDYPALAVVVVPLIFAPLLIRVIANLVELRRQTNFLNSHPVPPRVILEGIPVANESLLVNIEFPRQDETWNHMDILWRVGVLPPSREVLLHELGRNPNRQPPPGLSTELPHHWVVGLDDGTAGGEDAPMEVQEVQGGLYLRPMRIMASSTEGRLTNGQPIELPPPTGVWPGSVNTDLLRIHWECIVRINRSRGGPLLWVEPLRVSHSIRSTFVQELPLHDGRSELDTI